MNGILRFRRHFLPYQERASFWRLRSNDQFRSNQAISHYTEILPCQKGANSIFFSPSFEQWKCSLQILIDNNNRAYGVEYERHGHEKRAYSNKEVIVSAGAMNSPKLLLLSGIGPKDHLDSLNVSA